MPWYEPRPFGFGNKQRTRPATLLLDDRVKPANQQFDRRWCCSTLAASIVEACRRCAAGRAPSHAPSTCRTCCSRFAGADPPRRSSQWRKSCTRTRPKRRARTPRAISISISSVLPASTAIRKRFGGREKPLTRSARVCVCDAPAVRALAQSRTAIPCPADASPRFGEPLNKEAG